MRKTLYVILSAICFISISTYVNSAQYDDYEWGLSKQEVKHKIRVKGYIIETESEATKSEETIMYYDYLFGYFAQLTLHFTPVSKKLYGVVIVCENEAFGEKLLPLLEQKYGKAEKESFFGFLYSWKEGDFPYLQMFDFEDICLTTVKYCSEKYYALMERELNN